MAQDCPFCGEVQKYLPQHIRRCEEQPADNDVNSNSDAETETGTTIPSLRDRHSTDNPLQ